MTEIEPATDEFIETWRKRATAKLANNPRAMATTSARGMLRLIARIDRLRARRVRKPKPAESPYPNATGFIDP